MAAILRRGSGPSLRRLERGEVWEADCRRVCRAYPASRIEPRFRSDVMANPLPIGMRVAADNSSCLSGLSAKDIDDCVQYVGLETEGGVRSSEDMSHIIGKLNVMPILSSSGIGILAASAARRSPTTSAMQSPIH